MVGINESAEATKLDDIWCGWCWSFGEHPHGGAEDERNCKAAKNSAAQVTLRSQAAGGESFRGPATKGEQTGAGAQEQAHRAGQRRPSPFAQDLPLHQDLQVLRDAGRAFSAALDPGQIAYRHPASAQWFRQAIGGGNSVLNRQVDSGATNKRHGVRRITNQQESGHVPQWQTIRFHRHQRGLLPIARQFDTLTQPGHGLGQ